MKIVARAIAPFLAFFASFAGPALLAQEPGPTATATGECCPTPSAQAGSVTGAADSSFAGKASLDGKVVLPFVLTGSDNAGSGMASSYVNQIFIGNVGDRPYQVFTPSPSDFNPGMLVPAPGFMVFTWNTLGECEFDCSELPISIPTTVLPGGGWDPAAFVCCCPITQSGGGPAPAGGGGPSPSDADFTPQGQLNPDGQSSSLPGRPLVASSNRSGAQLWWHRPIRPNVQDSFIEVRHWDGTVARYERLAGVRVRRVDASGNEIRQGDAWKLVRTTDPYDNVTSYAYDLRGQLVKVSYPNGLYAHWNWAPAWVSNWAACSGIEIRHTTSVTPPAWGAAADLPHEDSSFLVFENLSGKTHFAGKPIARIEQRGSYVPAPPAGQVYDVAAEATGHKVTEFTYGVGNAGALEIGEVSKYWHPSYKKLEPLPLALPGRVKTLINAYSGGKIASQVLPQLGDPGQANLPPLGILTNYFYETPSSADLVGITAPSGITLQKHRTVNPDQTENVQIFDPTTLKIYRSILLPGAAGRPRQAEGLSSALQSAAGTQAKVEPEAIWIDFTFDATCVCNKPIRVDRYVRRGGVSSGLHTTRFEYDPVTKWVTAVYTPNPASGTGLPAEVVETTEYTFDASAVWSPRWISRRNGADGEVLFTYPNPMLRTDPTHGSMQGKVVETWNDVRLQATLPTPTSSGEVTTDVVRSIVLNIPGNAALAPLAFSGPSSGFPRGQVRVSHADGRDETMLYDPAHGRLAATYGGGTTTSFAHDWWGRLTMIETNVGSALAVTWNITQNHQFQTKIEALSGSSVETRYHYDFWGNHAVTLRKNRSANGGSPARHGGASSARAWIREERIWQDSWLREVRVDRRPVDESDGSPFSVENPLFLVTKYDYVFASTLSRKTIAPNGAVTEQTFDGFGTPFRTVVRESSVVSAQTLEVSRVYNDDWMHPAVLAKGATSSAASLRVTMLSRNAAGSVLTLTEPSRPSVVGYTYSGHLGGAVQEFDNDNSGQVVGRRLKQGGTLIGEWSYRFDQLGRAIRTSATVLGAGSGKHDSITTYMGGHFATVKSTRASDVPVVVQSHDPEGRLSTITDLAGNLTTYTYVPGTQLVASVSRLLVGSPAKTFVTSYQYDNLGRVVQSIEGVQTPLATSYTYTSLGVVEQITDPMGRVQRFLHDALGRRVDHARVGDGANVIRNTATFVDSGLANSRTYVSQFDGLGHETRTQFDFAGRQFLIQHGGANFETMPTLTSPQPRTELFVYDGLSQVTARVDGDGGITEMEYDASGRLIMRRLTKVSDAIAVYNARDVLNRDAFGRIVLAQSDSGLNGGAPNGTAVVYDSLLVQGTTYDSLSRVHEEAVSVYTSPQQVIRTKSSFVGEDRFRSTLRYEDGLNAQNLEMGFGADAVRRLNAVTWNRPGVGAGALGLASYSWLGSMRQQRTSTFGGATALATGVESYTYDEYGRMTQMKDVVTPTTGAVVESKFDYTYNAAHNLVKEEYAKVNGSKGDRFTYDAYHRIRNAYMGVNATVMAGGDPTTFSASTMTQRIEYDLDEVQSRTMVTESTSAGVSYYSYQLADEFSNRYMYAHEAKPEYDNRGNLTFDGQFYYRYDFLNRLQEVWKVSEEGANAQQSAAQSGDKYMVIESVDALDSSRKDVEEDVFNLMRRVPKEHTDPTFRSRLRSPIPGGVIKLPAASSAPSTSGGGMPGFILPANLELVALYGYDAFNRRVIRVVVDPLIGGAWVSSYDGWREVVEHELAFNAANPTQPWELRPVKQFVHGSGLDEILAYRRKNGAAWEDYHILHGGQDTAAKLVNQSGAVVEQYEYDPFGKATVYTSTGALVDVGPAGASPEDGTRSAYGLPHLYKAMRFDPETGNCYVRNRYYDPVTGQFMSRDPVGVWGDAGNMGNEYAYAWNRPLVVGDPHGLQGVRLLGPSSTMIPNPQGLHAWKSDPRNELELVKAERERLKQDIKDALDRADNWDAAESVATGTGILNEGAAWVCTRVPVPQVKAAAAAFAVVGLAFAGVAWACDSMEAANRKEAQKLIEKRDALDAKIEDLTRKVQSMEKEFEAQRKAIEAWRLDQARWRGRY